MKKFQRMFITLAICALGAASHSTYAWSLLPKKETFEVTVLDPFANMRTGPGRGYPIYHVVEKNDVITILKRKTNWYKVKTGDDKYGWVSRDTLENTLGENGDTIDFSQPNWEEFVNRKWEFGVMGGNISGDTAITTYVAYHFTHNIATEVRYGESFGNFSSGRLASINIVHTPFPDWLVSPFFTLGTGVRKESARENLVQLVEAAEQNNILSVGTGANYYLTSRLLMRLEYNIHTSLTTEENNEEDEEWKVGFSVFF